MAFSAQIFWQAMSVFAICSNCAGILVGYYASRMGIMTGNACHFAVFVQRQSYIVFFFHGVYSLQTIGRRPDPHMIGISGMLTGDMVTSAAHHLNIAQKRYIFEGGMFFIRFFVMTDQTRLDINFSVFIQLKMGVHLCIMPHGMTLIAKIRPFLIGCASQGVPVK